jgi:hypothetical protein
MPARNGTPIRNALFDVEKEVVCICCSTNTGTLQEICQPNTFYNPIPFLCSFSLGL